MNREINNELGTLIIYKKEELLKMCDHIQNAENFIDALLIVLEETTTKNTKKFIKDLLYHESLQFDDVYLTSLSIHFFKKAIEKYEENKYSEYFMMLKQSNTLRAVVKEIRKKQQIKEELYY